jgi:Tol biopolymer transport system component
MKADGTGQTNLTNNPSGDFAPVWSPDGSKIAFLSGRDGGGTSEIYLMNVDGSDQINLTDNPANDRGQAWKP